MKEFEGKRILVTGGLGFLGSNIIHKLAKAGAALTVVDSLDPRYGGNLFNVAGLEDTIRIVKGDIRDGALMEQLVTGQAYIFNLAAQASYIDSNRIPFEDLDVNCRGPLVVLEACRKKNRDAKVVFASSRMVLGRIIQNPVSEDHPTRPLSLYGIHKLTAEKYHLMYSKNHGIRTVVLRLTNPYGERQQVKHDKYCLPGWFMRCAMEDREIPIFGDGKQLRDYVYVTDAADAFLLAAASDETDGEVFNCGAGESHEFREMVEAVVQAVGRGKVVHAPWPEDYENIETGDFRVDVTKLRATTGWRPRVEFREGISRMVEYYKRHLKEYLA